LELPLFGDLTIQQECLELAGIFSLLFVSWEVFKFWLARVVIGSSFINIKYDYWKSECFMVTMKIRNEVSVFKFESVVNLMLAFILNKSIKQSKYLGGAWNSKT